jgi:hypothetical protein
MDEMLSLDLLNHYAGYNEHSMYVVTLTPFVLAPSRGYMRSGVRPLCIHGVSYQRYTRMNLKGKLRTAKYQVHEACWITVDL